MPDSLYTLTEPFPQEEEGEETEAGGGAVACRRLHSNESQRRGSPPLCLTPPREP